jgi:TolB-like protein
VCHLMQFTFLLIVVNLALSSLLPAQIQIAIGEFINESNIYYLDQWEQTIPDMLQTKLSGSPNIAVLERRKLKAVLEEQALALSGLTDSLNVQKIGTMLQAEYIILGSIHELAGQYRIDANIVKVKTGQIQSEKVVSPDMKHLSEMVELLGNNILYSLTGNGEYKKSAKISKYPTKYFLAATVGLGVATLLVRNEYKKSLDEYHNNTELEQFDKLYDKANFTNKLSITLATLTGTALVGTIYCWLRNLSTQEIYTQYLPGKTTRPFLALNWKNEVIIGVQIQL